MTDHPTLKCRRCGADHEIVACPYVKAVEFSPTDGRVLRIEFLTPADYGARPSTAPAEPPPAAGSPNYRKLGDR